MTEPDCSENPYVKNLELVLELLGQDNNRLKSSVLDEYFMKRKLLLPKKILDKEHEDIETEVKLNLMDKVEHCQVEKSDIELKEELQKRSSASHAFVEEVSHTMHFTCTSDIIASIKHEVVMDESVTDDDDPLSDASLKVGNVVTNLNAQKFNTIIEGEFLTDERSIFFDWGGREGKPVQPDHNYVAHTLSGSRPCIGRPAQDYSVLCLLCRKTMEKDQFYHHLAAQHYRAELLNSFPALWAVPLATIKTRVMELVGESYAGRIVDVPSSSTAAERRKASLAETNEQLPPQVRRDKFYIGNDEFYLAKDQKCLIIKSPDCGEAQHATPTLQLRQPYIPTSLHPAKLRHFHRQPLREPPFIDTRQKGNSLFLTFLFNMNFILSNFFL